MAWRCSGYKKPPRKVYRAGGGYVGRLPLYGVGECAACGRVVALAPKSQTVVYHKS